MHRWGWSIPVNTIILMRQKAFLKLKLTPITTATKLIGISLNRE